MKISSLFEEKKPVLSFEIFPPKKEKDLENIGDILSELSYLNPDFISVTFGAGGSVVNNSTINIAKMIKEDYGIEPVVHLTCLNHSKDNITNILDQLAKNNLTNILALRGDRNPDVEPKKDFLHASDLVSFIRENEKYDFGISAACYPEGHMDSKDLIDDIKFLKTKVDCGVDHLISQLFFDNQCFYDFSERCKIASIDVPIDAGIMPVTSKSSIERMVSLCGASLPSKFTKVMQKYEYDKEALFDAGTAYAINQIVDLIAHDVDGIHIYTMNNPKLAKRIVDGIKNLI